MLEKDFADRRLSQRVYNRASEVLGGQGNGFPDVTPGKGQEEEVTP